MGRAYAVFRTDIWGDDDWRNLTPGAQWLYEHLLTSSTLSHAGVADWRPGRIARLARSLTVESVRKYADELIAGRFILIDEGTEEVGIRSFLRHDGVLTNPNLWKSLGEAYAGIFSDTLKAQVTREVGRLRNENPDGMPTAKGGRVNPWASKYLQTLLKSESDTPSDTPSDRGSDSGWEGGSDRDSPPIPTPTPIPKESSPPEPRKKETTLPKDWAPTAEHIKRAKDLGIDLLDEAENFRLHAETHDRRAANWNGAFTTWLKKAKPKPMNARGGVRRVPKNEEWMYR